MTTPVTLVRVFDRDWNAWLRGMEACRRKPSRRAVHDLRVASRRLQALLLVLGHTTGTPRKALHRLEAVAAEPLDTLSPLRDAQVQRHRIEDAPDGPGVDALCPHFRRREARRKKRARRALGKIDLAAAAAAASAVRKSVAGGQGAPTPDERTRLVLASANEAAAGVHHRLARVNVRRSKTLHRLRVAIKRFRYSLEVADVISPGLSSGAQPSLRALQRGLGRMHDADLLAERVDRFVERHPKHRSELRAFKAWLDDDRARSLRALTRALPRLPDAIQRTACDAKAR